jgi:hypothetical protein
MPARVPCGQQPQTPCCADCALVTARCTDGMALSEEEKEERAAWRRGAKDFYYGVLCHRRGMPQAQASAVAWLQFNPCSG